MSIDGTWIRDNEGDRLRSGTPDEKGGDAIVPDNNDPYEIGGDAIGPAVERNPKANEKRLEQIREELKPLLRPREPNGDELAPTEIDPKISAMFSQLEQDLEVEMASEVGSSSEDVDTSKNTDRQERSKQISTQAKKASLDIDADAIRKEIQTLDNIPAIDVEMPEQTGVSAQAADTLVAVKGSFGAADELPLLKSTAEYMQLAFTRKTRTEGSLVTPAFIKPDSGQDEAMSEMEIDEDGKQVNVLVLGEKFSQMSPDERTVNLVYYVQKWKQYDILGKTARGETGERSKILLETSANLAMLEAYVKLKQLNPNLNLNKCEAMLESVKEDGINGLKEYSRKALELKSQSVTGNVQEKAEAEDGDGDKIDSEVIE